MNLVFIEERFSSLLKNVIPYGKESMVKNLFPDEEGEQLKRKERLFEIAMAVMKSKSTSALDKYSTEDIISCIEVHDEICKVMEGATAGKIFSNFLKVLTKSRSCKKRRVL